MTTSKLNRLAYTLVCIALIAVIFLAWTAVPDCYQPGVCG